MLKYIYRDLINAVEYLPYGLALGIPLSAVLVFLMCLDRRKQCRNFRTILPVAVYGVFLAILLVITFFSRESGSSVGSIDLELGSTWRIYSNDANHALVVENVLLFIPYGFLCCWAFAPLRNLFSCALFGALTSMAVESLQLATGRGYFQIDDILTNILGTVIGFLLFLPFLSKRK